MGKVRNRRAKRIREGGLGPTIARGTWLRKPQTQVVPNKKAESRRAACRRWQGRGDFFALQTPHRRRSFFVKEGDGREHGSVAGGSRTAG